MFWLNQLQIRRKRFSKHAKRDVFKNKAVSLLLVNPRRACAARVTVLGLSVCYRVFCHHAQQTGKIATPTGSALHRLHFKNGDFRKSAAFRSYGLKTK